MLRHMGRTSRSIMMLRRRNGVSKNICLLSAPAAIAVAGLARRYSRLSGADGHPRLLGDGRRCRCSEESLSPFPPPLLLALEDPLPTNPEMNQSLDVTFARSDGGAVLGAMDPEVDWDEAERSPYADQNPYTDPRGWAKASSRGSWP
jgi:hypothetical protein